jgi:nicotinate-nucleotide adenylyltransferase
MNAAPARGRMPASGRRLGVFGGSFDPVHNGHLAVAALAREHLGLQTVLFVPAGLPPHKLDVVRAPAAHRVAMLRAALAGEPGCVIYRGELLRSGPSYTLDTVRGLLRRYPGRELYLIVGSDTLAEIPTWHRYRELLGRVTLAVAHRPGYGLRPPPQLRGARVVRVPSPEWGVSSTQVRSYLAAGRSCAGLLPRSVRNYVRRHGLYR